MRMRRKRNLEERLAGCSDVLLSLPLGPLDSSIDCGSDAWLDFRELFGNDNPVELEIGCGKGRFVCQMAANHPERNFIAVEKTKNVIVSACEQAQRMGLANVRFIPLPVEYLLRYIPPRSVGRIYLNFSCPYPKSSFANRRLTHPRMLDRYKVLMRDGGEIIQKTDNQMLFEFSIGTLSQAGFSLHDVTLDLHSKPVEDDVMTEYEQRFVELGQPIYRLIARLPRKEQPLGLRVCVFGSASNDVDEKYLLAAEQLGEELARNGHEMIFGGGARGVMGAAARGAAKESGRITGVAPRFFDTPGILYKDSGELILTQSMSERKDLMIDMSDAFITAPGGLGTLDELFEVLTLRQLGRHSKPVILLNTDGFFDSIINMLDELVKQNFMTAENRAMVVAAEDAKAAVALLKK